MLVNDALYFMPRAILYTIYFIEVVSMLLFSKIHFFLYKILILVVNVITHGFKLKSFMELQILFKKYFLTDRCRTLVKGANM